MSHRPLGEWLLLYDLGLILAKTPAEVIANLVVPVLVLMTRCTDATEGTAYTASKIVQKRSKTASTEWHTGGHTENYRQQKSPE